MANSIVSRKIGRQGTDLRAIAPPTRAAVCTPTATADDTFPQGATLYVGVTGDLSVVPWANDTDTPVLYKAVPVGFFDVRLRAVLSAATTATNIVAHW